MTQPKNFIKKNEEKEEENSSEVNALGVCKKLSETDRTVAKFSVRFRFHFLKTEIFGFGFGVIFFHLKSNRNDRIYIFM